MKPHSHDVGVARAFDCFCKKVLRNEARDYQDALARKRNREVYFSELPVEVLEQFAVRDTYFTDTIVNKSTYFNSFDPTLALCCVLNVAQGFFRF